MLRFKPKLDLAPFSQLLWDVFPDFHLSEGSRLFCYPGLVPDSATMRDRAK